MATITKQTIRVDLTPGRVYPVLHVSQGDVGLEALEFYIYQNGQPFTIPSEVTAINIDGMTPVGVFSYPCTWTGNVVTAGLTATMTAERGIDICELALYDATNNKIGTCNFVIAVEESPYTNAHVSTSDMATIMAAATEVQQNTLLSKSWAVGDTGIREGEDTNNSKYYADQSRIEGNGLASVFSDVIDYSVGDYVIYNGILYRFTENHAAGAWIGSDAEAVNLADEMNKYLNAFIADFDLIRSDYTSAYTGRSRVYYSIISAEHKPKMFMAGEIGDAIYPDYFLPGNSPTIMVNASVFNTTTNVPVGVIVNDGAVIQENNIYGTDPDGRYILYMDEAGALQAVTAIDHSAQDVINDGAVWAITAWDPIVLDGVYVGGIHSTTDAHPRSVIGQNSAGDYIVLVCDGRQYNSRGMSFKDIYDFVVSIGFTPRILYNLDGGSSCSLYAAGVRVNSFNNDSRRAIPNVLAFTASGDNVPLMLSERMRNIAKYWRDEAITNYAPTIEAENIVNLSFRNAGVNGLRGIVRKSNNGQYTFSDAFKLGQDGDNQAVFVDGDVGGLYQRLLEFLPSNILKIFGSAIFMLKSEGVDAIGSSTDFKTFVNNGIWFVGANNANNPTSTDSFLVVFAYLSSRFQMLINTGTILIRTVNEGGTYASAWKTIYSGLIGTSVAANSASGVSGTFYVNRKNGMVMINGDFTVGTPVASAQLNSVAFPIPASGSMTQLVFSNNATLRVNLDTSGALKFGSNVSPAGGSLNSYGRISFTYIEAE